MIAASPACLQTSLDLFPAPTFESVLSSRQIQGMNVRVSGRLSRGWYVKMNMRQSSACLVVPAFLENSPHDIKTALVDWALLATRCRRNKSDEKTIRLKKQLERTVHAYIDSIGMAAPRMSRVDPLSFVSKGRLWDLAEVFGSLNKTYFSGSLSSFVRWGKNKFRAYQSNMNRADGSAFSLITIATMYNLPDTPRYAVEGIMFHEMLHIAVPPVKRTTRNIIHGAEFKRRERLFPCHGQWLAWEKSVLKRIV